MPQLRAQIPEMTDFFPRATCLPITIRSALQGVPRYLMPYIPRIDSQAGQLRTRLKQGESPDALGIKSEFQTVRLSNNRPAPTIVKDCKLAGYSPFIHPTENRSVSIGELRRLCSYPDSFVFSGKYFDAHERIGNSVPPLFMEAIARNVRALIGKPAGLNPSRAGADYVATLEAAWADHLVPRAPDAPTVISLFAGCGGSSLGYSMAGYRELLAVEWDDNAVATFRLNFPDVLVHHGDIGKLTVDQVLSRTGLEPGQLDVLDGSPPCQGFSTSGRRQFDDSRNGLFREYVRLLRGLKPRAFVMENVSGMVKGKMKLVFAEILCELKASGYKVRARLLNAMYFGVPQSRERMIFVGVRDDLDIEPIYPRATSVPVASGEAIQGCDCIPLGRPTLSVRRISSMIRPGDDAGNYTPNGTAFSVVRLDPKKPAPTITKVLAGMSGVMQPTGNSYLSEAQIKRLGSFPDSFCFIGNGISKWARIGNSVPPLFMRSIVRHVRAEILGTR